MIHNGWKPYKCAHCDQSLSRAYSLKMHMMKHIKDKPFKCSQCEQSFTQADKYVQRVFKGQRYIAISSVFTNIKKSKKMHALLYNTIAHHTEIESNFVMDFLKVRFVLQNIFNDSFNKSYERMQQNLQYINNFSLLGIKNEGIQILALDPAFENI